MKGPLGLEGIALGVVPIKKTLIIGNNPLRGSLEDLITFSYILSSPITNENI